MEFRSPKTSFRFLFLTLFSILHLISCQNCGVPKLVKVKQSDQLTETLDTGQLITTIKAFNVKHVKSIPVNPNRFASAFFDSNESLLVLKVDTPFWSIDKPESSFIDEKRLVNLHIVVELECSDGREKNVTFNLPIRDENTQNPVFDKPDYQVVTEPCIAERCMMIFDADVIVMDRDRDEVNAKVDIYTTSKDIEVLGNFTSIEPWVNTSHYPAQQIGYLTKVRLGITSKTFPLPKTISFQLLAQNIQPYVKGEVFLAQTNITIIFEEFSGKTLPPVFSNPFYYTNFNEFQELEIKPSAIKAITPWDISDSSSISYGIVGTPHIFIIDKENGHVKFKNDLDRSMIPKDCTINYTVIAKRTKLGLGVDTSKAVVSATATLLVIFPTSVFQPPDHTDPTCSPECFTTPWPGTCPQPEPCPGTTTEPPGPNTTTSTMPPTWSTESVTWSTGTVTDVSDLPTTTEMLTTELPTESPITPPPANCSCNCEEFSCSKSQIETSVVVTDENFADPFNCTVYHSCKNGNRHEHTTHRCPTNTIYCPNLKHCTDVVTCLNAKGNTYEYVDRYGYENGDDSSSENDQSICTDCTCNKMLEPGHPKNVCNESNFEDHIPDPDFCDIYHRCQPLTIRNGRNFITLMERYYDIPMRCNAGLIFCKKHKNCVPPGHYEECDDCPSGKAVKQCDVCMGRWKNFDIFTQRFK